MENGTADLEVGACCSGRGWEKEVLDLPAQGRVNQDQNPKQQHRKRPKNVGQPRMADPPDEAVDQELGQEEEEEFQHGGRSKKSFCGIARGNIVLQDQPTDASFTAIINAKFLSK